MRAVGEDDLYALAARVACRADDVVVERPFVLAGREVEVVDAGAQRDVVAHVELGGELVAVVVDAWLQRHVVGGTDRERGLYERRGRRLSGLPVGDVAERWIGRIERDLGLATCEFRFRAGVAHRGDARRHLDVVGPVAAAPCPDSPGLHHHVRWVLEVDLGVRPHVAADVDVAVVAQMRCRRSRSRRV